MNDGSNALIPVKSKLWSAKRTDWNKQNAFVKYANKPVPVPILPPSAPPVYQQPSKALVIRDDVNSEDKDSKDLINELLKPKEYKKITVLPSDRKIEGLTVDLLDHQVSGIKFLLHREKVKPTKRDYLNEFNIVNDELNNDSNSFFNKGGILADDMGLGKTIQIISLILSNQPKKKSTLKTTLIVCPASLVTQWCSEFDSKAPSLKILSYHGPKRPNNVEIVHNYDVVVTSYQTLSSDHGKRNTSPLYHKDYPFRRIVLDEAHTIKNRDTKAYSACTDVESTRRWCLTGTPIQNKIDELYSLLSFLKVNKYENFNLWNLKIQSQLNSKNSNDITNALTILHKILDKFMIRRTKSILIENNVLTVTKIIYTELLDFTPFESNLYKKLKMKIIKNIIGNDFSIDEFNKGKLINNSNINLDYMSVFTYLLRLRQLCCHWELLFNLKADSNLINNNNEDEDSFTKEITKGISNISMNNDKLNDVLIDDDINDILDSMKQMTIGQKELNSDTNVNNEINDTTSTTPSLHAIKIQRILNILKKDNKETPRKTIIFSEFTSMLKILSQILFKNNIKFVQYDGTMDKKSKDESLNKIKNDPTVHVLLLSLKCGAYGLNITSCSRVILYEPFWNPAIGSQAIDRCYRIGQLNNVDVYEFFINDTIEIRIKELQDKKKELMKAVIDKDAKSAIGLLGNGLSKVELFKLLDINIE